MTYSKEKFEETLVWLRLSRQSVARCGKLVEPYSAAGSPEAAGEVHGRLLDARNALDAATTYVEAAETDTDRNHYSYLIYVTMVTSILIAGNVLAAVLPDSMNQWIRLAVSIVGCIAFSGLAVLGSVRLMRWLDYNRALQYGADDEVVVAGEWPTAVTQPEATAAYINGRAPVSGASLDDFYPVLGTVATAVCGYPKRQLEHVPFLGDNGGLATSLGAVRARLVELTALAEANNRLYSLDLLRRADTSVRSALVMLVGVAVYNREYVADHMRSRAGNRVAGPSMDEPAVDETPTDGS